MVFVEAVDAMKDMGGSRYTATHSQPLPYVGGGWRVSFSPRPFYSTIYSSRLPLKTRLVGPQSHFGRSEEKTLKLQLLPDTEIDPTACQKPSHWVDYSIQA